MPEAPFMQIHKFLGSVFLVSSLALLGCPKEEKKMEEKPAPAGAATRPAPGGAPSTAPATQPATQPGASMDSAKPFSGLVKLAEGVPEAEVKESDVLFIMARKPDSGQLVAVQRHAAVKFPLRYEISAKDLMMPATPFEGPFSVAARLDRDGDPMTKGEQDLYASYEEPVTGGREGVHLELKPMAR